MTETIMLPLVKEDEPSYVVAIDVTLYDGAWLINPPPKNGGRRYYAMNASTIITETSAFFAERGGLSRAEPMIFSTKGTAKAALNKFIKRGWLKEIQDHVPEMVQEAAPTEHNFAEGIFIQRGLMSAKHDAVPKIMKLKGLVLENL